MHVLLIIAAMSAGPAFSAERTIELIWDAEYACSSGEDHDGTKLPKSRVRQACADLAKLTVQMKEHGWCANERKEWARCE